MAKQILDNCITCGRCERTCPLHCVYPGPLHYEIKADACAGCGRCADLCPVGAITDRRTGGKEGTCQ